MSDLPVPHTWKDSDRFVPRRVVQPLQRVMGHATAGAVVMLGAAVAALIAANSPLSGWYERMWAIPVRLPVGGFDSLTTLDLRHWVNDGLMTLFFLLVSTEIKRELVSGHLRELRAALMPVVAAAGGMVVPALLFLTFNWRGTGERGWGVPMATDIVFAVALITVFGRRLPTSLRVFLLTLAVVDDLGAILVIALFYNQDVQPYWLAAAAATVAAAAVFRRVHVRSVPVYVVLGALCWYALLRAGVHPTVAGVAFGLLTPAWSFYDPKHFAARARSIVDVFRRSYEDGVLTQNENVATQQALRDMKRLARETESPLGRAELALAPWVTFVVVPVFAFANAGVPVDASALSGAATLPVLLGVAVGLVVGKPLGIAGTLLALRGFGVRSKPPDATWLQIIAVAACGGVGFTVALFVGELAFPPGALADQAKIGILLGSGTATIIGAVLLQVASRSRPSRTPSPATPFFSAAATGSPDC